MPRSLRQTRARQQKPQPQIVASFPSSPSDARCRAAGRPSALTTPRPRAARMQTVCARCEECLPRPGGPDACRLSLARPGARTRPLSRQPEGGPRAPHVPVRRVTHGDSRSFTEQPALLLTCATAGPAGLSTSFASRGSGGSSPQLDLRVRPRSQAPTRSPRGRPELPEIGRTPSRSPPSGSS
jgi:hypothetical protein